MIESSSRPLTPPERRLLQAKAQGLSRQGRRQRWAVLGIGATVFGALWAWTLAVSEAPWHLVTAFWLAVGGGITLWQWRDRAVFGAMADGIHSALRADRARVVDVDAAACVAFEEVEDEGACYAFQVGNNRVLFLSGQQYYETAAFPCLAFSIVEILDERERIADQWIERRGPKVTPQRTIPASVKRGLELPEDQETVDGTLDRVEALLAGRKGQT